MTEDFVSVAEAAALFGESPRTVRRNAASVTGCRKIGGVWLIPRGFVDAYLAAAAFNRRPVSEPGQK